MGFIKKLKTKAIKKAIKKDTKAGGSLAAALDAMQPSIVPQKALDFAAAQARPQQQAQAQAQQQQADIQGFIDPVNAAVARSQGAFETDIDLGQQANQLNNLSRFSAATQVQLGIEAAQQNQALQQLQGGFGGLQGQVGGINTDLSQFQQQQAQAQSGLGGVSSALDRIRGTFESRLGGLRDRFQQQSTGTDPQFEAMRQAQLGQIDTNQQAQQAQQSEFFGRRGLGGSSAALNAQQRLAGGFDQQRQGLTAQLGMQQLGRQDNALQQLLGLAGTEAQFGSGLQGQLAGLLGQSAGLAGSQAGIRSQQAGLQSGLFGQQAGLLGQQVGVQNQMGANLFNLRGTGQAAIGQQAGITGNVANLMMGAREQNLNARTAGIENASIPGQLGIAAIAAQNAGGNTGGGGVNFTPQLPTPAAPPAAPPATPAGSGDIATADHAVVSNQQQQGHGPGGMLQDMMNKKASMQARFKRF